MPEQDPRTQATQTPEKIPNIDLRQADQNGLLKNPVLGFVIADTRPGSQIDEVATPCDPYKRKLRVSPSRVALGVGTGLLLAATGGSAIGQSSEREAYAQDPPMQPNTDPEFVADYCMTTASDEPQVTLHRGARKIKQAGATLQPWISDIAVQGPLISPELGRIPCPGGKTFKIWRFMENDKGQIKRVGPIVPVVENSTERIRGYYDVPVYDGVKHTCWKPNTSKNSNSTPSGEKKESAKTNQPSEGVVRYRRSGFKTRKTINIAGETKTINNTFNDVEITPAFGRGVVKIC